MKKTYCCQQCKTIVFRDEYKTETNPLTFTKTEHIEFEQTKVIGLPVLQMKCLTCHTIIGYVRTSPLGYIPYKQAIEVVDSSNYIDQSIITNNINNTNDIHKNENDKDKDNENENEINTTQIHEENNQSIGMLERIQSVLYNGLRILPFALAFFAN